MEKLTAKEYLLQIQTLDLLIESKKKERKEMWQDATGINSALGNENRSGAGTITDKVGRYAAKLTALDEAIDRLCADREERIALITRLKKPLEFSVLYKYYVEYKQFPTLATIAKKTGYSAQYINEVHIRALKRLKIPKNIENYI